MYGHYEALLLTSATPSGGGGGSSAAPTGLAVPVALGTPSVGYTLTTAPTGLTVPVALGTPTTSTPSTAPTALAVPVALGTPTTSIPTAAPTTLAVPVALGTPSVVTGVAAPNGLAIPVAIGTPSVGYALTAAPNGLGVPVTVGTPATSVPAAAPTGLAVPAGLGAPTVTTTLTASPTGLAISVTLGTPSVVTGVAAPNGLTVPVGLGMPTVSIPGVTTTGIAVPVALGIPLVSDTVIFQPQEGARYEIEEIMDALANTFNGLQAGYTIGGTTVTIECYAEVTGEIAVPALVLELDDQEYDINMGHGADALTIVALMLVQYADAQQAQRELWRFLSRNSGDGITRLKGALEANQTLGGLVSYAIMRTVRNIGLVNYGNVEYLGAEIVIEVVS